MVDFSQRIREITKTIAPLLWGFFWWFASWRTNRTLVRRSKSRTGIYSEHDCRSQGFSLILREITNITLHFCGVLICYTEQMKIIAIRLHDGQDLLEEIQRLVAKHEVQAGVVLSAVGSLKTSNIRVPVIDGKVKYITPANLEIDSLQGTVSKNGCHLHIVVSDAEGKVSGGHMKEGCVIRTTCELVIGVLDRLSFNREPDEQTGFDELTVSSVN